MNEMRINLNSLDATLFQIGNLIKMVKKIGWYDVSYFEGNEVEINYLNYLVELIKNAYSPEHIAYLLDCEIIQMITRNRLDTETIEKLLAIKHLAYIIQSLDWENFMGFANKICKGSTRDKLNFDIL